MGQSKSKEKQPRNATDVLVYREQKKRQKKLDEEKRRKQLEKQREKQEKKKKGKNPKNHKSDISTTDGSKSHADAVQSGSVVAASNYQVGFRVEDYDHRVALKLDEQISNMFAHFCLNQIVLAMQFYGNYQSEKSHGYEEIYRKEAEQNQYLDKHSILLPNALDEAVQQRIQYKSRHGPDKCIMSPLQLQTMYVIFENVEISKPEDANYDSINPICKVDFDTNVGEKKMFKGYLRLRLRETSDARTKFQKLNNKISDSSFDSNYVESYNGKVPKLITTEPQYDLIRVTRDDSHTSGIDLSGSEYAYITSLNTHQPLSELSVSKKLKAEIFNAKVVPESCITLVEYQLDQAYAEGESDNDSNENSDTESYERDVVEVKYLNSKSFFCYFATVLKDHLAQDLALQDVEFNTATWKGASIFTQSYEIIPAIHVQIWPNCAFEWKRRVRPIFKNPLNGQQLQWPTPEMIKRVEGFGCHVIPIGYAPKVGKNKYRELEWKIVFPKAERYLESLLTDTQVKVFMIAKMLIKTFLEQKRDIFMFTMDHLRMHLFWECEKNYGAWPEEFLGEVLLRFLRSFLERTRSKNLPDYFIVGRNMFECIPESTIVRIHQIISQIVQNPVIHMLVAYRNLEQLEPFFPKLSYKKLYSIITVDNPLKLLNRIQTSVKRNAFLMQIAQEEESNNKKNEDYLLTGNADSDEEHRGLIGFSYKQERKALNRKSKRKSRARHHSMRRSVKEVKQIRKESIDSIDLHQFIFSTNLEEMERGKKKKLPMMDDIRRSLSIEMFIKQFIHQAKASYDHKTLDKARIYLNQAYRLCTFLEKYGDSAAANSFRTKINELRASFGSLANSNPDNPPALPERTSLEPVKSFRSGQERSFSPIVVRRQKSISIDEEDEPITPRSDKVRSVHFESEENAYEPRSFFSYEAEVHEPKATLRMQSREEESHPNKGKLTKKISFKEKTVTIETSSPKPVTREPKSISFHRLNSGGSKLKKQVSIDASPVVMRKSILRVNSKSNWNKIKKNGILKQSSIDSTSSQNAALPAAPGDRSFKHASVSSTATSTTTDDYENVRNPSLISSATTTTTTSELEENTEGLTYKEIFERRKNLIHRKLITSLTAEPEQRMEPIQTQKQFIQIDYNNGYTTDSDDGNSTDL